MSDYTYSGVMYVLLITGFIGLCVWAWSGKRKKVFDEMANLPLDDDIKREN